MKGNIYILTIHHIPNFGSELQAFALQNFLEQNQINSKIIDYRPNYFKFGRSKIKAFFKSILFYKSNRIIRAKSEGFIKINMKLTDRLFSNFEDLKTIESTEKDIFIAGGDQLWNSYHPCGRDGAYKLLFVKNGKKLSYGTSIGRNNLSQDEIGILVSQISDFRSIGLREWSSVEMLKNRGLNNLYNAVDPVLLLDKKDYTSLMKKKEVKRPYVLFYMIKGSELINAMVKKAKEKHMHVIQVGGRRDECDCDERLLELSPDEMLGLIMEADCIVSSSFHATVFAVMFNKPFYSLLPNESTNARIIDFLSQLGLQNQIVKAEKEIKSFPPIIDFSYSNIILQNNIKVSKNNLLAAIGRIYEQ